MVIGINTGKTTTLMIARPEIVNLRFGGFVSGCLRFQRNEAESEDAFGEINLGFNSGKVTTIKPELSTILIKTKFCKPYGIVSNNEHLCDLENGFSTKLPIGNNRRVQLIPCNSYDELWGMPPFENFRDDFRKYCEKNPNSPLDNRYSLFMIDNYSSF